MAALMSFAAMGDSCPNRDSPYGINYHAPSDSTLTTTIDEARALGLGWIRVDFDWLHIEVNRGAFSWGRHDAIVAAAEARGLLVFATLAYSPQWATQGPVRVGHPNPADWENFVYQAVRRYDGRQGRGYVGYWGLWNEPNLSDFYQGTRQQYIHEILRNGADMVRAANPHAKVLGPELAHVNSSAWWEWLNDCIVQAGDKLDIVTHHVYGSGYTTPTRRLEQRVWPWDPPSVKEVLQQAGWLGKPFWLTEIGWQSGSDEAQQAANYTGFLNNWFTGDPARSWIHKVFFYELYDTQLFPDLSWGILGPNPAHARKQAFDAYALFIASHPATPASPAQAIWPEPQHLAVDVPRRGAQLRWGWPSESCPPTFQIYLGTDHPAELLAVQSDRVLNLGPLDPMTTYAWRVDALNDAGAATGAVWSFTTGPISGDFDADGDVDQEDFAILQNCLGESSSSNAGACLQADLNRDSVVNLSDFEIFRACLSGPGVPPDGSCDQPVG